jgi:hypothetical protein
MMMRAAAFPSLDHLLALTDDVGIFQHARRDVPHRGYGYCTDDVARALIVAVEASRRPATAETGNRLVSTYLAFLADAQLRDGWFHNFMGYDRRWQDVRGSEDAFGRAVWALGHTAARAPRATWRAVAAECFERALPCIDGLPHLRSRAYASFGLAAQLEAAPHAGRAGALRAAVAPIAQAFRATHAPDWRWCEETMTYDNARLPEALLRAGLLLGDAALVDAGRQMFGFLCEVVIEDGTFVPVGNEGWYTRGGHRARFGQQPLEAASFVDAALVAYAASGDPGDRAAADVAWEWFGGRNVHRTSLVSDGGCRDGLDAHGTSENMGAESTLAYLMAAIAVGAERRSGLRLVR